MKKFDMLPILAAFVIALLILPTLALPVNALTPATGGNLASVVTIPEDDLKRNTGVMVLGLSPTVNELWGPGANPLDLNNNAGWFSDSFCTTPVVPTSATVGYKVGPELTSEPITVFGADTNVYNDYGIALYYGKNLAGGLFCEVHYFAPLWISVKPLSPGMDLLSQHKILATLNGVPTKPDYVLCEIVEKEKAKIPPATTKDASKRQFDDEMIKTTLRDVTNNFICKFHWVKPGVGALDVYFIGPKVKNFIADHMLIVTVGYKVGRTTVWASDLQDICILGWSMGAEHLAIYLFKTPGLSLAATRWEYYHSWDDPLHNFVSCDEAAAWQLAWIAGGWPYSTN